MKVNNILHVVGLVLFNDSHFPPLQMHILHKTLVLIAYILMNPILRASSHTSCHRCTHLKAQNISATYILPGLSEEVSI